MPDAVRWRSTGSRLCVSECISIRRTPIAGLMIAKHLIRQTLLRLKARAFPHPYGTLKKDQIGFRHFSADIATPALSVS